MLEETAPEEEFDEAEIEIEVSHDTQPVTVKFFLEELERFKRPGVRVEVWGNKDDAA